MSTRSAGVPSLSLKAGSRGSVFHSLLTGCILAALLLDKMSASMLKTSSLSCWMNEGFNQVGGCEARCNMVLLSVQFQRSGVPEVLRPEEEQLIEARARLEGICVTPIVAATLNNALAVLSALQSNQPLPRRGEKFMNA